METYDRPDKSYIKEHQNLTDVINTSNLVQKNLPKQVDIDKILDVIQRKVLKGTHLPLTIKEIQAGYLTSPFFKDLYRYMAQIMCNQTPRHFTYKEIINHNALVYITLGLTTMVSFSRYYKKVYRH